MVYSFWIAIAHLVTIFVGVVGLYWFVNWRTKCNDQEEILTRHNDAYLKLRLGMVLGPIIATLSTVAHDMNTWTSVSWVALAFGVGAFWAVLGNYLIDWLFLYRRGVDFEDTNVAVAHAKAGFALGMGLVTFGAFVGDAPTRTIGFLSLALFTTLAAIGLLLSLTVFSWLFKARRKMHRGSLRRQLLADNPAAGWYALTILLSTGLVLAAAMAGDFTTWADSLKGFGMAAVVAMGGSIVGALAFDLIVLTGKGFTLWGIMERREASGAKLLSGFMLASTLPVALVVNQYIA